MKKYRKKPIVIEALLWGAETTTEEMALFVGTKELTLKFFEGEPCLVIHTLEGDHFAKIGDYIIKGVSGEFYPCKPDIFGMTYEEVE